MAKRKFITDKQKRALLELFKAHYSPKEASIIMGISYAVISNYYRGFRIAKIDKYNRFLLISGELRNDIRETKRTANSPL